MKSYIGLYLYLLYYAVPQLSALVTIRQRVTYKLSTLVQKCAVNGRAPEYLAEVCRPNVDQRPGMTSAVSGKLHVPSMHCRRHLVTGRSPSLVRAPGTTYLTQSEIRRRHSQRSQNC